MTAQEVWEYWKDNPKAKFDNGKGGAYIYRVVKERTNSSMLPSIIIRRNYGVLGVDEVIPLYQFMEREWHPVEEWRECTFLEAIEAWVNGSKIKSVYRDKEYIYQSQFLSTIYREQILNLIEARTFKWYIKE